MGPDEKRLALRAWIDQVDGGSDPGLAVELARWSQELSTVDRLLEPSEPVRIALVGTTGAGKSTLLNAIVGQEILPVGVMAPVTAFVTSVRYSEGGGHHLRIRLCSELAWQRELEALRIALQPGDEGETDHGESKRLIKVMQKRASAVADRTIETPEDVDSLLREPPPAILGIGEIVESYDEPKPLLKRLRELVREDSRVWPLIEEVAVSGPFEVLQNGLELVDLPGLNDPNEARVEVTRRYLRTAPFTWLVFNMVRGVTQDVRQVLQEEQLLRHLVLTGGYHTFSLVGTKADEIDSNVGEQLGLPEDVDIQDLIRAYGRATVADARRQLEEMVRDLGAPGEDLSTTEQMAEVAQMVVVHTTSANAHNRLAGIGRLLRDYGLVDLEDTGIPAVRRHLEEIGREEGRQAVQRIASQRLDLLRDDIVQFCRARSIVETPAIHAARSRLQLERQALATELERATQKARSQLEIARERFLASVDPLLDRSVHGVKKTVDGWSLLHWATLRAVMTRGGVFRRGGGRSTLDFNEDLASPLLDGLPVGWERYFTIDLRGVVERFMAALDSSGDRFAYRVAHELTQLTGTSQQHANPIVDALRARLDLMARETDRELGAVIRQHRTDLAEQIPLVVGNRMSPAYDAAREERGPGMKSRIIGHLERAAVPSARPIFETIRVDLLTGLSALESRVGRLLGELRLAVDQLADHVAHNAEIDVADAVRNERMVALLASVPEWQSEQLSAGV